MSMRSVLPRRCFSLMGAAIVVNTMFFLQFLLYLQVQKHSTLKTDLGGQEPKEEEPKEIPFHGASLRIGTSVSIQHGNDNTLEKGSKELASSNKSTIMSLSYLEKIDWNDYGFYAKQAMRKGRGEHGKSVILRLSDQEKEKSRKLLDEYHYDAYVSDRISVERAIKDTRSESCKTQHFIKNIPQNSVSVIIVFHNERNSTLLRTVHSVVNRSPAILLREVILVDDLSIKEELKEPLDLYVMRHFDNVKVIRNNERLGLIRSRVTGADASSGTFLVFFDAHVEVNSNYLPPLLEPMLINYRTITCPMVDIITEMYFNIIPFPKHMRGIFDWTLTHKTLPAEATMNETTPLQNPVMIGCAFAITRDWWEELEKYDLGLQIWGGEQFELSFKSWMCGGSVVDAPCSRVAHLFRSLPYISDVVKDNKIEFNLLRVASVWMDEYKEFVVQKRHNMIGLDPGDLTKQFELKKKLNCKSFDWYINNIAPDIFQHYPLPQEPSDIAWGYLRNRFKNTMCLMNKDSDILLMQCEIEARHPFSLNWRHTIRFNNTCWTNPSFNRVLPSKCIDMDRGKTQQFAWNKNNGQIVNFHTHLCVDCDFRTGQISMAVCDTTKESQSWTFDHFNDTLVDDLWERYRSTLGNNS